MINFTNLSDLKKKKHCNPITYDEAMENLRINSILFVTKTGKKEDVDRFVKECDCNLGIFIK